MNNAGYVQQSLNKKKVFLDFDIAQHSSIGVGGKVAFFAIADNLEALLEIYGMAAAKNLRLMVIGGGTNIVFNEGFLKLAVLKLGKDFDYFCIKEKHIQAGAGLGLQKFVIKAAKAGYDFSHLAGIPGTLGGAVWGNSGNICSHIQQLDCLLDGGRRVTVAMSSGDYGYRSFRLQGIRAILSIDCKAAVFNKSIIFKKIRDNIKQKKQTQPIDEKSAGCFFKNPPGIAAGKLIEDCGLKGFGYGGAAVSAKHANFIINLDNASAEDIDILAKIIQDTVYGQYHIKLEHEVRMIGFENGEHD